MTRSTDGQELRVLRLSPVLDPDARGAVVAVTSFGVDDPPSRVDVGDAIGEIAHAQHPPYCGGHVSGASRMDFTRR